MTGQTKFIFFDAVLISNSKIPVINLYKHDGKLRRTGNLSFILETKINDANSTGSNISQF